jgi:hypothetical protein
MPSERPGGVCIRIPQKSRRPVRERTDNSLPSEACVRRGGAKGKIMVKTGAVYQPELIELMKTALDEAASALPVAEQTSAMRVKLASRILCAAAQGVRDPTLLRVAALLEIEGELHQSYARLRRLRQRVEKAEAADSRRNFPLHRGT